jgi:DNA (cytosine-5)-methyltransferase 1
MRQGLLAQAPIWSDVRNFAGRPWRSLVDGLIGGIPCQPHSLAGRRLGAEDERDLWGDARRIIVQARPWFVLIENVGGMLSSGGAERVIGDLRRLGYQVEVGLFSAAEVGASHERQRVFILAMADCARLGLGGWLGSSATVSRGRGWPDIDHSGHKAVACGVRNGGTAGIPAPTGRHGVRTEPAIAYDDCDALADSDRGKSSIDLRIRRNAREDGARATAERVCGPMDDADGVREQTRRPTGLAAAPENERAFAEPAGFAMADAGGYSFEFCPEPNFRKVEPGQQAPQRGHADRRDLPLFPPGPTDIDGWRGVVAHLPHLEPAVRRMADGMAARLDLAGPHAARIERLRLLGKSVVPLQAAYAIRTLCTRLAASGSAGAAELVRLMGLE